MLSSNEVDSIRYLTFLVSTFYKVDFYTLLSTRDEVTFACKCLLSTSFSGGLILHRAEDTIILPAPLLPTDNRPKSYSVFSGPYGETIDRILKD